MEDEEADEITFADGSEQQTVASTVAATVLSNAKTSVYSKKIAEIGQQLDEEAKARAQLENKVREMKEKVQQQEHLIGLNSNDNKAIKMAFLGQRNQITSADNYMRHPQIEDL